ncbi:MAG TPA: DUF1491 family protein [Thermohalobaculum sp.]|nr:DUF1491 family protein [Thermohalobaculum sp.]
MIPRLASGVWVAAYLARLEQAGIYAHVMHRGDGTAGAIGVKVALMNGRAQLLTRRYDFEGQAVWDETGEAEEPEVDAAIARQRGYDPDLWVIEVEDPRGRHLLGEDGL